LEIARIEAGLLFFPYDMAQPGTTPWEVGAGWTVDLDKPAFRGRAALAARRDNPRSLIVGLDVASDAAMPPGAPVLRDGAEIGRVTSAVYSRHLMKSLAMAQISPAHTAIGTRVEIQAGAGALMAAHVVQMPFYDPQRLRTATPPAGSCDAGSSMAMAVQL
jgi:aminomethyltransferase